MLLRPGHLLARDGVTGHVGAVVLGGEGRRSPPSRSRGPAPASPSAGRSCGRRDPAWPPGRRPGFRCRSCSRRRCRPCGDRASPCRDRCRRRSGVLADLERVRGWRLKRRAFTRCSHQHPALAQHVRHLGADDLVDHLVERVAVPPAVDVGLADRPGCRRAGPADRGASSLIRTSQGASPPTVTPAPARASRRISAARRSSSAEIMLRATEIMTASRPRGGPASARRRSARDRRCAPRAARAREHPREPGRDGLLAETLNDASRPSACRCRRFSWPGNEVRRPPRAAGRSVGTHS